MKKIISAVEKLAKEAELEIEKREEYYDSRSEKWLDSDAAADYEEVTDSLRDLLDAMETFLNA
jgi:hypothetical protein